MFWIGVVVGMFIGWILFERPKIVTELVYRVQYWVKDRLGA